MSKVQPNNAEFARFKNALGKILKVSKTELKRRLEEEKRKPIASPSSVSSPKRED